MPKRTPRRLGDLQAQTAENVDLRSGRLVPWKLPSSVVALPDTSRLTVYKWRRNNSYEWLSWAHQCDVIKAPVADDEKDRIFYLDADGKMRVKGWDSYAQDRSCTIAAPSKVASYAMADRFNWSNVTAKYYTPSRTEPMTYLGLERSGDTFRFKFRLQGYKTSVAPPYSTNFRLVLINDTFGMEATGSAMISSTTAAWPEKETSEMSTAYDRKMLVKTTAGDYVAEMVLTGVEDVLDTSDTLVDYTTAGSSTTYYVYSRDVTFVFDMNFVTASIQYQYYVSTWVDDWGMESPPSAVSDLVPWYPGHKITLTWTDAAPSGQHILYRRLYRSAAGTNEDKFYFVADIAAATMTHDDTMVDADLGEEIELLTSPPSGLGGMIVMPGGFVAAFKNRELYMSPPYIPWSMPVDYQLTFDHDIVAIAASGNDIVVMTKGNPYYVTGSHPELMTQTRLEIPQSCVAKRGVCHVGSLVIYPSPDGLVGIEGGQARLITEPYYNRAQWQALTPSSMIAEVHDNMLYAHMTGAFLILDLVNGFLTTTDQTCTGLYADIEDDLLYLIQSSSVTAWGQGTSYMTLTWKSKQFQLNRPWEWNTGRVFADDYTNLTYNLYANEALVTTVEAMDEKAFRVPLRRPERIWELEIINDAPVTEISISMAMEHLR